MNRQEIVLTSHITMDPRRTIDAYGEEHDIYQLLDPKDLDYVRAFRAREDDLRKAVSLDILESLRFPMIGGC